MSSRDREFTEFVAVRGPALWRTASLLEPDLADAERAIIDALAQVRRRWSHEARDDNAERAVRDRLYDSAIDRAKHPEAAPTTNADEAHATERISPARAALRALDTRQRLLLVLTAYEGLGVADAAHRLSISADSAASDRVTAEQSYREAIGAEPGTRTLMLLDAAASRDMPPELAERAASTPNSRRRSRTALIASAVVIALAITVVVEPWSDSTDAANTNVNEWGIPLSLPDAQQLPTLVEQPVTAASTAYVVDGIPVVTEAASGEARLVFDRDPTPDWYDAGGPGRPITTNLLVDVSWSQAVLSPDGEWLVLVQALKGRDGDTTSQTFLVHLPTATPTFVRELRTAPETVGPGRITRSRIAWDPRSEGFACVCGRTLTIVDVDVDDDGEVNANVNHTPITADAIVGGLPGLAVHDRDRGWWIINRPSAAADTITNAQALAMTFYNRVLYLTADPTAIYAIGSDRDFDGGRCTLWDSTFSNPIAIEPFRETDGGLCTPMTMQSSRDGFALILRSNTPMTESDPVEIVMVDPDATTHSVGAFPPRTTTASLAAQLVG